MKPVSLNRTIDYVPLEDRNLPEAEQTVFTLKALTSEEETILEDMMTIADGSMNLNIGSKYNAALQFGIAGVRNFGDVVYARNQFKPKFHGIIAPLSDDFLQAIPRNVRNELAITIMEGSVFTEADLKN